MDLAVNFFEILARPDDGVGADDQGHECVVVFRLEIAKSQAKAFPTSFVFQIA